MFTRPCVNAPATTTAASAVKFARSFKPKFPPCITLSVQGPPQTQSNRTQNQMEPTTIIIATLAAISVVGLAWLGGYRLGLASGISAERELADRRIKGLLAAENKRKPRARRKAK